MNKPWTILVIEPRQQERLDCVSRLKTSFPDSVILEAQSGLTGLVRYRSQRIDCIVLQLQLPDLPQVIADLVSDARRPGISVIVPSPQPGLFISQLLLSDGSQAFFARVNFAGDDFERAINKALDSLGQSKDSD